MQDIIAFNRKTLNTVDKWILRKDWEMPLTLFNYGLPAHVFHMIDLPIDNNLTEVDYLCHLMQTLAVTNDRPIKYLEIGVSVGKNLYTVMRFVQGMIATKHQHAISGIDIEKMNPTLHKLLGDAHKSCKVETFANMKPTSIRSSLTNVCTTYVDDTLVTSYYEADEFSDVWTSTLLKSQFNLVFSDALHEPHALLHEYNNLKANNLLDVICGFFYCFDDLEADKDTGAMWSAVHRIVADMKTTYGTRLDVKLQHLEMNAWLGQHEHKHNFGVISAFPIQRRKIL